MQARHEHPTEIEWLAVGTALGLLALGLLALGSWLASSLLLVVAVWTLVR